MTTMPLFEDRDAAIKLLKSTHQDLDPASTMIAAELLVQLSDVFFAQEGLLRLIDENKKEGKSSVSLTVKIDATDSPIRMDTKLSKKQKPFQYEASGELPDPSVLELFEETAGRKTKAG